jgi:hypothetical protein
MQDIFTGWICWVCFSFVYCCYAGFAEGGSGFGASAEKGVEEEVGQEGEDRDDCSEGKSAANFVSS